MKKDELTERYAKKIEPILPLAKKAYGLRGQATPAHKASAEYTRLLSEYYSKGGSLVALADTLGVAYSGMRRRVFTSLVQPTERKPRSKATEESISKVMTRIKKAQETSTESYHKEIHSAYNSGFSLAVIAKELSLSSSAPLYYAVSRHERRLRGIEE